MEILTAHTFFLCHSLQRSANNCTGDHKTFFLGINSTSCRSINGHIELSYEVLDFSMVGMASRPVVCGRVPVQANTHSKTDISYIEQGKNLEMHDGIKLAYFTRVPLRYAFLQYIHCVKNQDAAGLNL